MPEVTGSGNPDEVLKHMTLTIQPTMLQRLILLIRIITGTQQPIRTMLLMMPITVLKRHMIIISTTSAGIRMIILVLPLKAMFITAPAL